MTPATGSRTRLRRRAAGAAAVALGLSAAALAGAPAAQAQDEFLQVSLDGTNFGTTVAGSVFSSDGRYVPGGTSTGSIWVRNGSSETAGLSAAAVTTQMDTELNGYVLIDRLESSAAGPADASLLGEAGSCVDLRVNESLAPGGTRRLDLKAGLLSAATNQTRGKQVQFKIVLLLDAADSGNRSVCNTLGGNTPSQPGTADPGVPLPGNVGAMGSSPGGERRQADAVVVAGTPPTGTPGAGAVAAQTAAGPATAPVPGAARPAAPEALDPAGFIESTVEPITRTWQGTLMTLLAVAFFAAAFRRIGTTRRTT